MTKGKQNLLIGLGTAAAVILLLVVLCVSSYMSAINYGADMETRLDAANDDSKSKLTNLELKVAEAAQVPAMYTADLNKLTETALKDRYGDGVKASFLALQEQNPHLDQAMYLKIQQIIEAGRDDFTNSQRTMRDVKRQYERSIQSAWKGYWLAKAGFPKIDLSQYQVIITDATDRAFTTHRQEAMKIKPN